jgi:acetolactate synthase-1/3 small subunit
MAQTFIVAVEDRPGVLNRVASLFRRRAFNIVSLAVGHTHVPGVSRMTVVADTDEAGAQRIEANLYKLLDVIEVEQLDESAGVVRELAMIRVAADQDARGEVLQLAEVFRARTVDVAPESLVLEITGTEDKIDGLVEVLRPYGVVEMVRTGRVAMSRGARATTAADARPEEDRPPDDKTLSDPV